MTDWIKITNLPFFYDEEEALDMFGDVGPVKWIHVERVNVLLKSTAYVQFTNSKSARLAAISEHENCTLHLTLQVVNKQKKTNIKKKKYRERSNGICRHCNKSACHLESKGIFDNSESIECASVTYLCFVSWFRFSFFFFFLFQQDNYSNK
ncbi:hypothetical protein RFI_07103 [Reticulomyxa filosa]|uniref:RRM domain-containing protein n=1 Tax=Reticulomyxa filosa TaxID=46433 RepID=X6NW17_RETFI|nr:hypothetical protein RFI_07103 [Reticulomyxa filosa]|eukprot:ETO30019.1 hypothetical protein RFI_07103 [Reticulomyxa filosa]